MPKNPKLRTLAVAALLGAAFLAAAAPQAAAHTCQGDDPAKDCGSCKDLIPHDHRYNDGKVYCKSRLVPCTEIVCVGGPNDLLP